MTRWEYARLESSERGINVVFTHRQAWTGIAPESFFQTLGRLGDEGWELVAALPLTATLPVLPLSAPTADLSAGSAAGPRDGREMPNPNDLRDPRERAPADQGQPLAPPHALVQISPDRWLVFKRPQPEPPPDQGNQGADMLKGLVGRQLLKGRLPLP